MKMDTVCISRHTSTIYTIYLSLCPAPVYTHPSVYTPQPPPHTSTHCQQFLSVERQFLILMCQKDSFSTPTEFSETTAYTQAPVISLPWLT